MTTDILVPSSGSVDFNFLWQRRGSRDAGRHDFEELVEQVVGLKHPDVSTVEANPGDWGIDAFIGDLDGGNVSIWQSKYFIDGFGKPQQSEVRDAYASAKKAAAEQGYTIDAWTLCVPVSLPGPMHQWWSNKKKEWERLDNIVIDLWDEGRLRRMILQQTPEARAIFSHYFNPVITVPSAAATDNDGQGRSGPIEVVDLREPEKYDSALFVKQMHAANLPQTRAAREAFYNAEILTQEITDKGVPAEMSGLRAWRKRIDSTWDRHFNDAASRTTDDGNQLPGLYLAVADAIEARHPDEAKALRATPVHGQGLMHQQVDQGDAGWTRDWSDIATAHRDTTTLGAPQPAAGPAAGPAASAAADAEHAKPDGQPENQHSISGSPSGPEPGTKPEPETELVADAAHPASTSEAPASVPGEPKTTDTAETFVASTADTPLATADETAAETTTGIEGSDV